MISRVRRLVRRPGLAPARRLLLALRGVVHLGFTFECPCCGWHVRAWVERNGFWNTADDGYCPRCNAKARHRRDWLYLAEHTNLLTAKLRVLEVAPAWPLSRRLMERPNIRFLGLDRRKAGPNVDVVADVTSIPLESDSVDAALCIHVLEHVPHDRRAMEELYRVLVPGGWALVTVPMRMDCATFEDSSVTDPRERERLFGERAHVRIYGSDLHERLEAAGFEVHLDPAGGLPDDRVRRFGLRRDENIFFCRKARAESDGQ